MSYLLYTFYLILNVALLLWGISMWSKRRRTSALLIAAVTFGLVYDNLILALGVILKPGPLFYALSLPRFYLHQLVLPWIIWASFLQARSLGIKWTRKRWVGTAVLSLTVAVVLLGVLTRIVPMDLQIVEMGGLIRYVDEGAIGSPIVSIVSIGFAGVMGWFLWSKHQWPWVLITALLVFIGEGIPVELVRRVIGSGAEVLFIAALLQTEKLIFVVRKEAE